MNFGKAKLKRESVKSQKIILRKNGIVDNLSQNVINTETDFFLKSLLEKELGCINKTKSSPPHIDIMKKLELVDYEPAADTGHFRFYPKGALIKSLLEDLAEDIALKKLEAIKIETPLLYRLEQKDIAEQAASFYENDYKIDLKDRKLLLRFAGDFGLFSMMKKGNISYDILPVRVYEISKSFRLEKSGECTGLKRLRGFTMPDIHCFCKDLETGLEEYAKLHKFYDELLKETELPFAMAFRIVKELWEQKKGYLEDRLKEINKDGMIEILDEMKHYWNLKNEFQYIDSVKDNIQLSTVQLDISDSARYGLKYIDKDGNAKPFVIVHSSMGSIERILGAVLEERAKEIQRGEKPSLPYWLSPTQLRLITTNPKYINYCERVLEHLKGVRGDIDDRNEMVGKKVRSAEKEWIPVYVVIGEKEEQSNKYLLKLRGKEFRDVTSKELDFGGLKNFLLNMQGGRPYRDSYLNKRVSKQLRFGSSY